MAARFGRKRSLLWNNTLFIAGGLCLAAAPNFELLCLGRLLVGLGAGIGSVVVPIYISELSPKEIRGTMGGMNQLSIVIGVLVTQCIGIYMSTPDRWRIFLGKKGS